MCQAVSSAGKFSASWGFYSNRKRLLMGRQIHTCLRSLQMMTTSRIMGYMMAEQVG